jgi:hypothetical protein
MVRGFKLKIRQQIAVTNMSSQNSADSRRFEEYFDAVSCLVGCAGRFVQLRLAEDQSPFWLVAFDSVPMQGSTTAFTFGVSSVRHHAWSHGVAPELVISVDSTDDDWWLSLGAFSAVLRGKCPFSFGNTLRLGTAISRESIMSAYLLFWPTILQPAQQRLELPDRTINFAQAYPIYESEIKLVSDIGAPGFFLIDDLDFANIRREECHRAP